MSDELEIKDCITMAQKRDLLKTTQEMKDVINDKEFKLIMLVYMRAIKRIERENGVVL